MVFSVDWLLWSGGIGFVSEKLCILCCLLGNCSESVYVWMDALVFMFGWLLHVQSSE